MMAPAFNVSASIHFIDYHIFREAFSTKMNLPGKNGTITPVRNRLQARVRLSSPRAPCACLHKGE